MRRYIRRSMIWICTRRSAATPNRITIRMVNATAARRLLSSGSSSTVLPADAEVEEMRRGGEEGRTHERGHDGRGRRLVHQIGPEPCDVPSAHEPRNDVPQEDAEEHAQHLRGPAIPVHGAPHVSDEETDDDAR